MSIFKLDSQWAICLTICLLKKKLSWYIIDWQFFSPKYYYLLIIIWIRYTIISSSSSIHIYPLDVQGSDIYRQRGPLRQPDLTGESISKLKKDYIEIGRKICIKPEIRTIGSNCRDEMRVHCKVVILYGNSVYVAHAWKKIGLLEASIRFVTDLGLIKCLKQIE